MRLFFALTGCGSGSNSFTWFVDSIPANLDPQVASASADVIACENLYSGLVRKDPSGKYEPALCERWEKSSDGLTYTFYLKDGLTYTAAKGNATDYAITAEDFVFAFRRLFRAETNSPYAVEFAALENSAAVLAGQMPESALGVTASGPLTLVFHLSSADDNFLEKLTLPGAMPCDEEFFNSTRGTYGLNASSTLSSGSFYIYNWTASGLFLRRAPLGQPHRQPAAGAEHQQRRAVRRRADCQREVLCRPGRHRRAHHPDFPLLLRYHMEPAVQLQQRVCFHRAAAGTGLRRAGVQPRCRTAGVYAAANGLVPDGLTVDGMNYRDTAGDVTPAAVDARALYLTARQTLTTSDFNKVSLMVPAGSGVTSAAEEINGVWQKEFSLFFSVEEVDEETFAKRLAEGDYTIALAPISAEGGSVYNMLNQFTAAGGGLTGYADSLYATQLQASTQATGSSRCRLLGDCERQLLNDAVAVPLFAQQKRLLIAPGIQNLIFDPFGPVLDLTYTTKE